MITRKNAVIQWIKALRSGKYAQGQGKLNQNNKFCCLGVLCEVLRKPLKLRRKKLNSLMSYQNMTSLPPEKVSKFMKYSENLVSTLVNKNDTQCETFAEIANYIESELCPTLNRK